MLIGRGLWSRGVPSIKTQILYQEEQVELGMKQGCACTTHGRPRIHQSVSVEILYQEEQVELMMKQGCACITH